ncbi:MAG: anthranilate synthase component I family protein, partial [Acidobacteria bacterium]|nr:anthranilate synthase component I family protein [Acidobacteriota bacterium]
IGFVAYEAAATVEAVPPLIDHPPEAPFFFAKHRAGIAISPEGIAYLFAPEGMERRYEAMIDAPIVTQPSDPKAESLADSLGQGLHHEMVERIREAICDGEVYQVNLTRAFSAAMRCEPADLYRALTAPQPPGCSAMIRGARWSVVSASPEIFLHVDRERGFAESRPIKGTVRRAQDDDAEIATLLASDKDAAEHLMIVDVVRNDFGKIAPPGQVTVPAFRSVRTLAQVHHLESTVRAEGLHGVAVADIMAALSPAASITGAPKRTAVRMIRELEPVPRGVYCGAIGMVSARIATFSVAIRTAVVTEDSVRYHAGGGIVWDSAAEDEDDECYAKAAAFLRYVQGEKR